MWLFFSQNSVAFNVHNILLAHTFFNMHCLTSRRYATPADFEGTIKSMMMRPPDVPTYNVKQQLPVIRGGVPMAGFAGMKKVASPLVRDAPSSASVRSNLDRAIFGEPDSDDFISSVAKGSSSTGPAGASRTDSKTSRAVKEVDGVMYEVLDELLSELGNEEMGSETPLGTPLQSLFQS